MITDTHAHLFWESYAEDRDEVLARARDAGVQRMLIVGTDLESSRAAFELCAGEPGLFPTAGIHPHDATAADPQTLAEIEALCRRPDCVAVGETGLDLFKEYAPRAAQERSFHWHLELARELDKPVIVHCREAHEATSAALGAVGGVRGVMHCYTMGTGQLDAYLERGFYISFSGVVTFPRNEENRAAAAAVPADRILIETDSPFLAPQGFRGQRNEPARVAAVLDCVAKVRGVSREELAEQTSANAARLFGLTS